MNSSLVVILSYCHTAIHSYLQSDVGREEVEGEGEDLATVARHTQGPREGAHLNKFYRQSGVIFKGVIRTNFLVRGPPKVCKIINRVRLLPHEEVSSTQLVEELHGP